MKLPGFANYSYQNAKKANLYDKARKAKKYFKKK